MLCKKKRYIHLVLVAFFLLLPAFGLTNHATAINSTESIKVGILHSSTGTMKISEQSLINAARLAIKEINNSGGVLGRNIEAVVEDGASDPTIFAKKAEKLIVEDNVVAIFGCWTSASRQAVLPVVEKYNHLLWYPVQYEGYESSPNIIYTGAAPNQQIVPAVDWCLKNLGKKAFLVGSDYVFPKTANLIVKKYLQENGGSCVGEEYLPLGDKNFQEIVRKIQETKPDFIFNTVNGDSNIGLFVELNKAGVRYDDIPIMSVSIAEDELRSIGTGITSGHYCTWNYFQSVDSPENRHFVESFKREYGMDRVTDDPIEAAYFQIHLFANAVRAAGSVDTITIREAAKGLTFKAPEGLVKIELTNQHTWKTVRIGKIKPDGQFEIVWTSQDPIKPDPYVKEIISIAQPSDMTGKSISELLDILNNPNEKTRIDAAKALGKMGATAQPAMGALIRGMNDQDWLVAYHCGLVLTQIGHSAAPYIASSIKNAKNAWSRTVTVWSLKEIGDSSAGSIRALVSAMDNQDVEGKKEIVEALGILGKESDMAVTSLITILADDDSSLKIKCLFALTQVGDGSWKGIPAIMKELNHSRADVRISAKDAILAIAQHVEKNGMDEALPNLRIALKEMKNANISEPETAILVKSINYLEHASSGFKFADIFTFLGANLWILILGSYIIIFIISLVFFRFVGLRVFPMWLMRANGALRSVPSLKLQALGNTELSLRHLLAVGFFEYNPKVMDAWVTHHLGKARESFIANNSFDTIKEIYIAQPILIDNIRIEKPSPRDFDRCTTLSRWCMLISGEGGVGKTALAFQIGLWATETNPQDRLIRANPMIPVFIDPGLGQLQIDNLETFKDIIIGRLKDDLAISETIPPGFIDNLLRKQRILVIVDDIEKLITNTWTIPTRGDFPVASLVVTSRNANIIGNIHHRTVEPLKIGGTQLYAFIDEYFRKSSIQLILNDTDKFEICKKLINLCGQTQEIPALFVKMYAEYILGNANNTVKVDTPRDIPELILGYLAVLNRARKPDSPQDLGIRQAASLVAWQCIRKRLQPSAAKRKEVLLALVDCGGENALTYLENQLKIIRNVGIAKDEIRFNIDPLAEYLAALYVFETFGNDEKQWDLFLEDAKRLQSSGVEVRRFFNILVDCSQSKVRTALLSNKLLANLAEIAGIPSEVQQSEPIKVGILHSSTGTMDISEQSLIKAARLAIKEINSSGGLLRRDIKAVVEDGASDPDIFAKKAEKLIVEDKVTAIFGCWTSASRQAVLPIVEKYNHLLWYPVQYEGYESSPNIIYTGAAPNQQIIPAVDWCLKNLRKKAFLVGSDYIFPKTANAIVKKYLQENGGSCVGEEYLPLGDKNFQEIVRKIQETKPDFIFNTVNGDSNVGLFFELYNSGITSNVIPVMSVSIAEDELRSIGTGITSGHYCTWNYFQSVDSPENRHFVESFKREYGMDRVTDDPIEAAYFQIHLFAKAVRAAGFVDIIAIREAAKGLMLNAPEGLVRIEPTNQHTWKTVRIGKIKPDGQFEIVWTSQDPIKPNPMPYPREIIDTMRL